MERLLLIFPVILASFVGSIPAEIKELRQQFNETLDKDDMVQNKLHQIEVKLVILNVELNRYKRSLRNSANNAIASTGKSVVRVGDEALVATTSDNTAVTSTDNAIVHTVDRNARSNNGNNGNRIGYDTANSIEYINGDTSNDYTSSVNIEDAFETKMVENIKRLESEKAKLKARLCKLDKKKNKLKKKLKTKSLVVFKTSIALGAILWSIGYLGVIILFMISTESHDGGDLILHKVYKSILGFTAGMFIQIFKQYYELDTK
ncbi:hypothetical protein MACJ_000507 [Theileria orientalis]|uniref:Uncharacterized protein n=1 Tax=Theileria orientalis TaxID=68886 RepID=A0A976M458_THEOR|nr:hypothetical protein MACJ_000507 [Theileria orientalis]